MRATRTDIPALVVAAQAGDQRALDELVRAHLPLVYTIVRRALGGHPDVDDVVQEVMLRALRHLQELRNPESSRGWFAAIAVRQIGTHLQRESLAARRTTALDQAAEVPDLDADFEDVAVLHAELSGQRRQTLQASRWLDPEDRTLLSLWWLETAGQLTRFEVAAALGITVAHTAVRVKRMRGQLDVSRSIVAALNASPVCAGLVAAAKDWDGRPRPLWRKRLARHVRSCAECGRATHGLVAAELLLVGFALLPVPVALTALIADSTFAATIFTATAAANATAASSAASASSTTGVVFGGAGGKVGVFGPLAQVLGAHSALAAVAAVAAGTLAVGAAVIAATTWPAGSPAPTVKAAPTSAPATPPSPRPRPTIPPALSPGQVSLEAANAAGRYVAANRLSGILLNAGPGSDAGQRATLKVVAGLADRSCFSFRTSDGWYLRHSSWRLRTSRNEGTALFRGDATFCPRAGSAAGSVSLESANYPGWFLRHRGNELWVDQSDGSARFRADSSYLIRPPLAD
jgi:RNA polymerase sigma factor (sigma-70 family)